MINILKEIFKYIKNRTKLNIIKYNKKILDILYITKEDFKVYESLKEFNEIFNLNIRDIDIEELDLSMKINDIEKLKYLNNITFKDLKKLILKENHISDITILEKFQFYKLEILDLSNNKISKISILENFNCNNLKELYLNDNNISDIKVLEKVKFEKL